MKWSEQMRVLMSEDEHYNQLMYDTDTGKLFINDELVVVLNAGIGNERTVEHYKFKEIIKKYPFFDDIKFLLNCIFVCGNSNFTEYVKPNNVTKYDRYYEINCYRGEIDTALHIYFKEPEVG